MIHLAAALWYFRGCGVYKIALIHGISVTEVHQSIWRVVNAVINNCSNLKFEFPEDWATCSVTCCCWFRENIIVLASPFALGPLMDFC
jgi:hypothetical protein